MLPLLPTIIIKGIILGFLLSIPLGPVAVLCVRRTLQRGRTAGLLSGAGAMTSDLIYAAIAYLGIGIVISLIEQYHTLTQILGCIIFFAFGLYMYKSPPNLELDCEVKKPSGISYFFTAFGSTVINPGILLLYLAGFSRFDFTQKWFRSDLTFMITMLSIGIGAMLWWTILTSFVAHIKEKVSVASVKTANRIFAYGVMIISVILLVVTLLQFLF